MQEVVNAHLYNVNPNITVKKKKLQVTIFDKLFFQFGITTRASILKDYSTNQPWAASLLAL
jgi:hypothetical protein